MASGTNLLPEHAAHSAEAEQLVQLDEARVVEVESLEHLLAHAWLSVARKKQGSSGGVAERRGEDKRLHHCIKPLSVENIDISVHFLELTSVSLDNRVLSSCIF